MIRSWSSIIGRSLPAEHQRDARPVEVAIAKADSRARLRERHGEIRGHGRFANPALAARDGDHVLHAVDSRRPDGRARHRLRGRLHVDLHHGVSNARGRQRGDRFVAICAAIFGSFVVSTICTATSAPLTVISRTSPKDTMSREKPGYLTRRSASRRDCSSNWDTTDQFSDRLGFCPQISQIFTDWENPCACTWRLAGCAPRLFAKQKARSPDILICVNP